MTEKQMAAASHILAQHGTGLFNMATLKSKLEALGLTVTLCDDKPDANEIAGVDIIIEARAE